MSAFGGEPGSINLQAYSPLHKAQHSLIKELGLDRVAKMTPWKKKLDDRIQTRESVVIQSLSSFLNLETKRFLAKCWEQQA
jgi:hypothetical protein